MRIAGLGALAALALALPANAATTVIYEGTATGAGSYIFSGASSDPTQFKATFTYDSTVSTLHTVTFELGAEEYTFTPDPTIDRVGDLVVDGGLRLTSFHRSGPLGEGAQFAMLGFAVESALMPITPYANFSGPVTISNRVLQGSGQWNRLNILLFGSVAQYTPTQERYLALDLLPETLTVISDGVAGPCCQFAVVPEPQTWGLMVLGFGSIGAVIRRRRYRVA